MLTRIIIVNLFITLLILYLIYHLAFRKNDKDKYILLRTFCLGIISAVIYVLLSLTLLKFMNSAITVSSKSSLIITAVTEELTKGIFILYLLKRITSGKIYQSLLLCGAIGLGFSFLENFFYFYSFLSETTNLSLFFISRTFLVPVMHIASSAILGYFLIKNKTEIYFLNFILGLASASLIHFLWNLITSTCSLY